MTSVKLLSLVLALVFLCGCASGSPAPTSEPVSSTASQTAAESTGPQQTEAELLPFVSTAALETRVLSQWDCVSLYPMGQDLLLLSMDEDHRAVLTVFSGESLEPGASLTVNSITFPNPEQFQVQEYSISYFDNATGETVALNSELKEILRVAPPAKGLSSAVLSRDLSTLYFGTEDGIYAQDLATSRLRCLYSDPTPRKLVNCLPGSGSVLKFTLYSDTDPRVCYLDIGSGIMVYEDRIFIDLELSPSRYYASFRQEPEQILLFGSIGEDPKILIPPEDCFMGAFLPRSHHAVLACRNGDRTRLEYYDLTSGACTAAETLPLPFHPWTACETPDGRVWLLGQARGVHQLCIWDPSLSPAGDPVSRTARYDPESPSQNAPVRDIQVYAESLSLRHGITILAGEDARASAPWDYNFLAENRPEVVKEKLDLLDSCLNAYPDTMLEILSQDVGGLTVSLVQGIYGKEGLNTVTQASGLQYEQDGHHYIALASEQDLRYTLFHELCHTLEHYVIPRTDLFHNWERLNPPGFAYDYDYVANEDRVGSEYLQDGTRAFIDAYAMSFPTEDRARLMEYAMTTGNQHYFQSPIMQEKLRVLSLGIREAFGLLEDPRTFLWEQYLNKPIS